MGLISTLDHGHAKRSGLSPTYQSWRGMRGRVKLQKGCYEGITCDPSWAKFSRFLEDMGERPDNTELDRIDGTKGYSLDNCRWTDDVTQNRNRNACIVLVYNGKEQPISAWAEELNIPYFALYSRIQKYGWSTERALTEPLRRRN